MSKFIRSFFLCRFGADEIHFNLMAIISDLKMSYQNRIDKLTKELQVISIYLFSHVYLGGDYLTLFKPSYFPPGLMKNNTRGNLFLVAGYTS